MEKQEFERQLSAVREEIDRIDKQLLPLFFRTDELLGESG